MGVIAIEKTRTGHNGGGHAEGNTIRSYAPASGDVLGEVHIMTQAEILVAVERARRAQAAWGVLPVAERCERLLRLRDAIVDHAEDIVEIITRECGKPRHEALIHEITVVVDLLTHYCARAPA